MKNCPKCGRVVGDNENFCPTCGYDFLASAKAATPHRSPYDIPEDLGKNDFKDGYSVVTGTRSKAQGYGSRNNNVNYNPPEKKNGWSIFGKFMGVLIVLAVIFAALHAMGLVNIVFDDDNNSDNNVVSTDNSVTEQKTVPDVVGFKLDVAQEKIREAGLTCVIEYREVNDIAENTVVEQDPEPYTVISNDGSVKIIVSKSAEVQASSSPNDNVKTVHVPNVVGLKLDEGTKKLKDNSLTAYVSGYEYSETTAEGYIMSQNPSGGSSDEYTAAEGSTVYLIVSKGKDMSQYVKLDDYTGRDISDVKKLLEEEGLTVDYTYSYNDYYPKDTIVSQNPGKETYLSKGNRVSFSVSSGKNSIAQPSENSSSNNTNKNKPVFSYVKASSELKPQYGYNYYASNALHADNTCWCEGVSGNGEGEYIMLYDDKVQTVHGCQIKNGYTYDSTVFKKNSRMSKVTFEFSNGDTYTTNIDPDSRDLQTIEFPKAVDTKSLKIIITEVKQGDSYEDTCITLIMPY